MVTHALNPKDARVLVVEDSPNDQKIVSNALKTFGIKYWKAARTAEEALKNLDSYPFDVALVDYNLPGMNGLQFLENLRRISPETSVIIVTGVRQEGVAIAAFKLGASDYISKDDYLTSGIVRSLQAALRDRSAKTDASQRENLGTHGQDLRETAAEAIWLLQTLDGRHGYRTPGRGVRDPLEMDLFNVVETFTGYLREGAQSFPEPPVESADVMLRALLQHGVSPRDLFRVYLASLDDIAGSGGFEGNDDAIRPMLLLTLAFASLVEELQNEIGLRAVQSLQGAA